MAKNDTKKAGKRYKEIVSSVILGEDMMHSLVFCKIHPFSLLTGLVSNFTGFVSDSSINFICDEVFLSTTAYSNKAANTSPMHTSKKMSTAFNPFDPGELFLTPMKRLIITNNTVTNNPIRPGIQLGSTVNDIQEAMTSNIVVR